MPPSRHVQKVTKHIGATLLPAHAKAQTHQELIAEYQAFLKKEEHRIRLSHKQCALRREGGLEVCANRSATLDVVLHNLFHQLLTSQPAGERIALVATGGYGRGLLNPGSDIDLLFLHPGKVTSELKEFVEKVLYMLWDVGFKVGYGVRSLKETFAEANANNETKSSLIESRFLTGERSLFDELTRRFRKECIDGQEASYLKARHDDLLKRHSANFNTFLVKEPHIKNGCGGLRDYHNILWISWVKLKTMDLQELVRRKILSETAFQELRKAFDFLMLVRNDVHYQEKRPSDALTLRAQGLVAKNMNYEGRRITQKSDAFMRDYYHHTRNIFQHNESLMERFEMELGQKAKPKLLGFLAGKSEEKAKERFDGFYAKDGMIFPENEQIFEEDSGRMIRLFQHTQLRHLALSPQVRQLFKKSHREINKTFQYKKSIRETFEAILSRKGDVGMALRQMHRVGFLGRYLPEFGALTDLVQHEFFHRYTADEHTLQTIEKLDSLSDDHNPKRALFQQLFHRLDDPFTLYLALIMHDTGRAADVKMHAYASEELADKVCRRLQVSPPRRQMLMFLVAHHLTLWQFGTGRDADDPSVVAEFGKIVQTQERLDALFIMTFADSSATYEHGWTDWKEMLLKRLYYNTTEFLKDQAAFQSRAMGAAAEVRAGVEKTLDASYRAEIEAHFDSMPDRYFRSYSVPEVVNHLKQMRKFFRQLGRDTAEAALTPVLKWIAHKDQGSSELLVMCWDRHELLAKIAGVLAAHNINILGADLFLRKDSLVLDIFRVCTTKLEPVTNQTTIDKVQAMVEAVFTGKEIDLAAQIAKHTAQQGSQPPLEWQREFPIRVHVSNDLHPDYTTVEIQALDRIGLLWSIFQAIGRLGLEITHARINTEKGAAIDTLYVAGSDGRKITDANVLRELADRVSEVVGIHKGG